jgi:glycosyltransferase involved in cell wall biosynthesis
MISIVMPAHNESAVIARSLTALIGEAPTGDLEIIVVCNGCSDNTAEIARRFTPTVKVMETDVASKANALNLGDSAATHFPRLYVDADVVLGIGAIRQLVERLSKGDVLAVAPTPIVDVRGCTRLVRAYYAVRDCLPSARHGLGGSGVYALSRAGRTRFKNFPAITADDAFVRLQFTAQERETLPSATSTVFAPRTISRLTAVRTRIYYGTLELARLSPALTVNAEPPNDRTLVSLLRYPRLWFGLAVYLLVNTNARLRARAAIKRGSLQWYHDASGRSAEPSGN